MGKLETPYRRELVRRIMERFPGCEILNNDPQANFQGIPDLTVLLPGGGWAMLETKRGAKASKRPNQDYYVDLYDKIGFAAFIYPENEEEVLDALQQSYQL